MLVIIGHPLTETMMDHLLQSSMSPKALHLQSVLLNKFTLDILFSIMIELSI